MIAITDATFENGVFRPDSLPALAPHTRVRLIVEPIDENEIEQADPLEELKQLWRTTKLTSNEPHLTRDQLHERR